jgi:hypothetical protein
MRPEAGRCRCSVYRMYRNTAMSYNVGIENEIAIREALILTAYKNDNQMDLRLAPVSQSFWDNEQGNESTATHHRKINILN